MTTDHVALAIINGTTPQIEAGTEPRTAAGKKRVFENVKSLAERRVEKVALATKIAPKMLGGFKVTGVTKVVDSKASSRVYLKFADKDGKEPMNQIPYTKEAEAKLYSELEKIEKENKLDSGSPAVMYRITPEYWLTKRTKPAAPATEKNGKDAPATKNAKAPVQGKGKAKETAKADAKVDLSKLKNAPAVSKVTSF